MKRFRIDVSAGLCGTDAKYYAYAESEKELEEEACRLAVENYEAYGGIEMILQNNFESDENGDYTEEQEQEALQYEDNYCEWNIVELSEDDEDFDDHEFDLVYDGRMKQFKLPDWQKVQIYNEFLISFHTARWTGHDLQPYFDKMFAYSYARTNGNEGDTEYDITKREYNTLINLTKHESGNVQ